MFALHFGSVAFNRLSGGGGAVPCIQSLNWSDTQLQGGTERTHGTQNFSWFGNWNALYVVQL